jgi:hypothetical protein
MITGVHAFIFLIPGKTSALVLKAVDLGTFYLAGLISAGSTNLYGNLLAL